MNIIKKIQQKKILKIFSWIVFCLILLSLPAIILITTNSSTDFPDSINGEKIVARITKYNNNAKKYFEKKPEQSLDLAQKGLLESRKYNYKTGEIISLANIGKSYFYMKKYDMALGYYEQALTLSDKTGNKTEKSKILNLLGVLSFTLKDYSTALDYYDKALQIRLKAGDKEEIAKSLNNIALVHIRQGNYEKAIESNERILKMYQEAKENAGMIKAYNAIGNIYYQIGKYNEALDNFLNQVELIKKNQEKFDDESVLLNIGKIFLAKQNYSEAERYNLMALDITIRKSDEMSKARVYTALGNVYFESKNYQKALMYYKNSLQIAEKRETNSGIAILLNNIGLVYKNLGNNQKALKYCLESLDLKEKMGDYSNYYYPLTSVAEIYLKLGNTNQALKYLYKALSIAESEKQTKLISEAYYLLHDVYATTGQYKKSLEYHKLYTDIKDTMINIETNQKFAEMTVRYHSESKQQENNLLRQSNEMQRTYFFLIIGLILILSGVVYNRYRSNKKANITLNEKNDQITKQHYTLERMFSELELKEERLSEANATKDKFFSIIAHDLRNPLHAITLSSDMLIQNYNSMSREQLIELIRSINKAGAFISDLLANLLQWARSQSGRIEFEPVFVNLKEIAEENIEILMVNADKKQIRFNIDIENDARVFADYNMTSTIFRNLISNAIKFTPDKGEVNISTLVNCDYVEVSVSDTGIGINEENLKKLFRIDVHHTTSGTSKEKGTGLGLILCKEFVDKHGGKIWAESQIGKGTTFKFTLPKNSILKKK